MECGNSDSDVVILDNRCYNSGQLLNYNIFILPVNIVK